VAGKAVSYQPTKWRVKPYWSTGQDGGWAGGRTGGWTELGEAVPPPGRPPAHAPWAEQAGLFAGRTTYPKGGARGKLVVRPAICHARWVWTARSGCSFSVVVTTTHGASRDPAGRPGQLRRSRWPGAAGGAITAPNGKGGRYWPGVAGQ